MLLAGGAQSFQTGATSRRIWLFIVNPGVCMGHYDKVIDITSTVFAIFTVFGLEAHYFPLFSDCRGVSRKIVKTMSF